MAEFRPGPRVAAADFLDHLGQIVLVSAATLHQFLKIVLGQKLQIVEQGLHDRVEAIARDMNLPLASEPEAGLWALGPESLGGRTLTTAEAPDFELPDINGNLFRLSSQKGRKIIVYAWAPY